MLQKKRSLKTGNKYKYFVYVSIIFLLFALYKANYLKIPSVFSFFYLIISFLFLFFGFIIQALCWNRILNISGFHVNFRECLAGHGLSIFGKYIPGKIWTIIGRAAYFSEKYNLPIGKLSASSINEIFISIWVGMVFGLVGLFLLNGFFLWGLICLFIWSSLTIIIFSNSIYHTIEYFFKFILKKNIQLPMINLRLFLLIIPWFIILWASWSIGFYLLVKSLTPITIPWSIALGFPLAGTLGIMAFIVPGGIGIREGIIVGYLSFINFSFAEATTISIASRLWFLIGEVFIFLLGWIEDRRSSK